MSGKPAMNWQVIGESVRGASHYRNGKPNQDAWASLQNDYCTILAVADGHGSRKHERSEVGARLAVETALALLNDFAKQQPIDDIRQIRLASDYLPSRLVQAWREAVDKDDDGQTEDSKQRYSLYGTTLLAALVTACYALYLQIGDGDLLLLNNEALQRPIPKNKQFLANETYSLSEDKASYHVDVRLQFFTHSPKPELIFLATDGYANSFSNESEFEQAVQEFQQFCITHGVETIQNHLADWLTETSEQGSGDDVTVAMLLSD